MPGHEQRARAIELVLLIAAIGCKQPASHQKSPRPRASSVVSPVSLTPRPASSFTCAADSCLQEHPRLPDSGEWRCAERAHVVWCAGGEPAAGVVGSKSDPSYRCGRRWGSSRDERVCIDRHPDYPTARSSDFSCRFRQELGIARHCVLAAAEPSQPLAESAIPACWLDQDCRSRRCDRGSCSCDKNGDCEVGSCRQGSCVEEQQR